MQFPGTCEQILLCSETNASMAEFEFKSHEMEEPFSTAELGKTQAFVFMSCLCVYFSEVNVIYMKLVFRCYTPKDFTKLFNRKSLFVLK